MMNGLTIKEMALVPELMKLHPAMTMLGGSEPCITGNVMITAQEAIALQAYVTAGER